MIGLAGHRGEGIARILDSCRSVSSDGQGGAILLGFDGVGISRR